MSQVGCLKTVILVTQCEKHAVLPKLRDMKSSKSETLMTVLQDWVSGR
jgi:hypothetical protein